MDAAAVRGDRRRPPRRILGLDIMSARKFKPIWLTFLGREPRRIDNAFDALECLVTMWPSSAFRSHRRAIRACRDALDGFISADKARRMLIEAAIDVDLLTTSSPLDHRSHANALPTARVARRDVRDYAPATKKNTNAKEPQPQP